MVFSSMLFLWIFLPITLVGNSLCMYLGKEKVANIFLLIASIFFYAWGEPIYIFLLFLSIIVNWALGVKLEVSRNKQCIFILAVILNLLGLAYFKYMGWFMHIVQDISGKELSIPIVTLPIGISFFTFQAMSYVWDVYRGEVKAQKNLGDLALYISFFPQLIAGPIVKYKDIDDQIRYRNITGEAFSAGITRFVYGLGKKVIVANTLAQAVDTIYGLQDSELSSVLLWSAALFYTLQIYFDFSGYSDMAIGLGKMFGFEFLENFNYPYISRSIQEFWRRCHISLGSWFRDYVYIPLGGSRKGECYTCRNLIFVFLLTGIWHGADYNFLLWGGYYALFIVMERLFLLPLLKKSRLFSHSYTLFVVVIGWVLFYESDLRRLGIYFQRMFFFWKYWSLGSSLWYYINIKMCVIFIFALFCSAGALRSFLDKIQNTLLEIVFLVLILVLSFASLAGSTYNPFIYFRF